MTEGYCIIVPCYRHAQALSSILCRLCDFRLPVIVVDDGNEEQERRILERACDLYENSCLLTREKNGGKGSALYEGLKYARSQGYTHALQIDADGQHDIGDIPKLIALSEEHPQALISACPLYDDSVPKARLWGRYITHFWVFVETLSFKIRDSMCGFRVYPIERTLDTIRKFGLLKRMDFDPAIMVELFWMGTDIHFLKSKVSYPEDGVSNFNALRDNLRISLMHTRLMLYMLTHLPRVLRARRQDKENKDAAHWAQTPETYGYLGMRIMLLLFRIGGRPLFSAILYPVILGYYICSGKARSASQHYLKVLDEYCRKNHLENKAGSSFAHFYNFGQSMIDKIASWQGRLVFGRDVFYAGDSDHVLNDDKRGFVIIGSHLGNIEALRALAELDYKRKVHALVFSSNAQRFKAIMDRTVPDSNLNLVPVDAIGLDLASSLEEKILNGEIVAILGDRVPVNSGRGGYRVSYADFLGHKAPLPQGPFILASILGCPVKILHALKNHGRTYIYCDDFAEKIELKRKNREEQLNGYIERYARILETYVISHPMDWFNFYNFWELPDDKTQEHR